MTLPLDLEAWLTDVGDQIIGERASDVETALRAREKLIYEIRFFDTEARNGGISQYFANRGMKQWEQCTAWPAPSFSPFARRVADLLTGNASTRRSQKFPR